MAGPRPNVSPFDSATSFVSHLAPPEEEEEEEEAKRLVLYPPASILAPPGRQVK
jgi:hypothetical protein